MATLEMIRTKIEALPAFFQQVLNPAIASYQKRYRTDGREQQDLFMAPLPYLIGFVLASLIGRIPALRGNSFVALVQFGFFFITFFVFTSKLLKMAQKRAAQLKEGQALKQWIKHKTIVFLDDSFKYEGNVPFPTSIYKGCKLFDNNYDRASAEDKVTGIIGQTPFELLEVGTYRVEEYKDSNGRTTRRYIPMFKGLLFIADFNKQFKAHTIVRTDKAESKLGSFGRSIQKALGKFSDLKLIELENPEFEKHFKVESNDPIDARYILTPSFMERLVDLREKYDENIQFAFMNSRVIIAFPHAEDFLSLGFELNDVTNAVDFLTHELLSVLEIVEDLDLNNKIWKTQNSREVA